MGPEGPKLENKKLLFLTVFDPILASNDICKLF